MKINKLFYIVPMFSLITPIALTSCAKTEPPKYFSVTDSLCGTNPHYSLYFYETKKPDEQNNGVMNVLVDVLPNGGECKNFLIQNQYIHEGFNYFIEDIIFGGAIRENGNYNIAWHDNDKINPKDWYPEFINPKVESINTFSDNNINQKVKTRLSNILSPTYRKHVEGPGFYFINPLNEEMDEKDMRNLIVDNILDTLPKKYADLIYYSIGPWNDGIFFAGNDRIMQFAGKWTPQFVIKSGYNEFISSFYEISLPISFVNKFDDIPSFHSIVCNIGESENKNINLELNVDEFYMFAVENYWWHVNDYSLTSNAATTASNNGPNFGSGPAFFFWEGIDRKGFNNLNVIFKNSIKKIPKGIGYFTHQRRMDNDFLNHYLGWSIKTVQSVVNTNFIFEQPIGTIESEAFYSLTNLEFKSYIDKIEKNAFAYLPPAKEYDLQTVRIKDYNLKFSSNIEQIDDNAFSHYEKLELPINVSIADKYKSDSEKSRIGLTGKYNINNI